MAGRELTPEQWQLFWDLKEMFPNVSGAALKQHLDKDHQAITDLILDGQLPAGDQFIGDSEPPVAVVTREEPRVTRQPAAPARPVGLMPSAPPRTEAPVAVPPATPRLATPTTPRVETAVRRVRDKVRWSCTSESSICLLCSQPKERVAHCHCINVDPMLLEEPDDAEHCVCSDCLKIRYMRGSLEGNQKSLFCLVKKCDRVISRDLLLATVDKPAMAEWMLGSNVSLREASVRQIDREKKRLRDEEAQLMPTDKLRFENILDYIEADDFVKASNLLPDACFSWILDNFDFGLKHLVEQQANATKRKLKRRDKAGVTHLVESRLKLQTTFTCIVCYEEYRTHLAVSCVVHRSGEKTEAAGETHSFCAECVRGQAKAALEQNVIVFSGIGIKCMQPGCANILMRAHIEQVLDAATLASLDPHFADEAIIAAGLQAEKCQRCAFAAILVEPPEQQPVFACRRETCRHSYCRLCGRVWDERHKGKSCDELDPELMQRKMAAKLDEMLIHKCPRCAKPFVKVDGCNKITCPCGQISCYICKQAVKGYDHFQDRNPSAGKCALWEDPTARERAEADAVLNQEINGAAVDVAEALRKLQ
ncbi:hypothetical protein PMAYCL1PPCAC_25264 [Pristionchus mayeri]|uniref:RING-type domain-containing protein n=1 Tax=Pristionchus mayeri TaxID=1317129 RepID=A0AAN5D2D0_9BILA|nr:hypothetical protein PMAYCL1PPCAC_25264 [Pristionchus mayeri]